MDPAQRLREKCVAFVVAMGVSSAHEVVRHASILEHYIRNRNGAGNQIYDPRPGVVDALPS
jgi:hypothetical protein